MLPRSRQPVGGPTTERPARQEDAAWPQIEQALRAALREIRYGSVEIVIHGSRVVQIERREKLRLDDARESG
jgi:hypothetical protein